MASEFIQPLDSLGPVATEKGSDQDQDNPAKKDYLEGRKLHSDGEYTQAAIAFHNALRGFEEQGDQAGVANASDRLGDACLARSEFDMAIANFQRACAICEKEDDSFSVLALNKKMAVIRDLETNRYEPVRLMDTLSQVIIEKRMWYTALDMKSDLVNISGIAMDDKTVADFMLRLESSGLFAAVNLKTLKQVEVQKTPLKSFEINCQKRAVHKAETKTTEEAGAKK